MNLSKVKHTHIIKRIAADLGFHNVGIARAGFMEEEAQRLEKWLHQDRHGKMGYMANHFDKRVDPTLLVPDSKSVISLSYNYYTDKTQTDKTAPQLSKYAYGKDYHFVVKDRLKTFFQGIQEEIGAVEGRVFVDSAPVLERDWAKRSGVGWVGKNTMLINPKQGSFFFLAEIILDLELVADDPIKDYCGTCRKCIDACPTQAIDEKGYWMDGSKCISYLTIELKDAIPNDFKDKMDNWMFGCDVCQAVCPWNRFSTPHEEPAFEPHPELLDLTKRDWEEMTEETFRKVFKKSAVKRTKYSGLMRNIGFLET